MLVYGKINFPIWCGVKDLNALGTFHSSMHEDKRRCVRVPRGLRWTKYVELKVKNCSKRTKSLKERKKRSCVGIHFPTFVINLWECIWVLGNSHGFFNLFSCLGFFCQLKVRIATIRDKSFVLFDSTWKHLTSFIPRTFCCPSRELVMHPSSSCNTFPHLKKTSMASLIYFEISFEI